jgi:hypothetical protein
MEQSHWRVILSAIKRVTRTVPSLKRSHYSHSLIAQFYFWAVWHDRPMTWALEPDNYTRNFRPRKRPSISQLNRRIASDGFQFILQRIHEALAGDSHLKGLFCDGQALCVSPVSQDRDARKGHVPGGFAKGYKLHAVVTTDGNIPVFSVMPLNTHELGIAMRMLDHLKHDLHGVLVQADGNYDAAALHKRVSAAGGCLITNPRGRAKHAVTRRQMGAARRLHNDMWDRHPKLMHRVYHHRKHIERVFGNLTCLPGLLSGLPKHVRGMARVRRYVGAKICHYHAHRIARQSRLNRV